MIGRYIRSFAIIVICLLSATVILLLSWLPKGGVYPFVTHRFWGPGLLWCAGAKLHIKGLEHIENVKNAVFICNHQSHYDIPTITTALPIPVYFIAKKELKKIPIFGWGMVSIGTIFVDRNNREKALESMKQAARQIAKGKFILTFPEGTRSKDGNIQNFKKGSFHLAKNGPLKLIPIAVSGTRDVLPLNGKLQKGKTVYVQIGKPIEESEVESKSIAELSLFAKERISSQYEKLKEERLSKTT